MKKKKKLTPTSVGPISSILSVKYSYRTVTLLGGASAALGMIISFWASSVAYLYLRYKYYSRCYIYIFVCNVSLFVLLFLAMEF